MASPAIIGALRVVLGADTASLEKGLKDAQSHLARFATHAKVAGALIGGALTAAAIGFGASFKKAIDDADKLGKLAQSIGIPVEELSRLKHAADLSDVSLEALGKSVGILSRNMAQAVAEPTSRAAQAFKALGISVRNSDGSLKSASDVITEVAGKFGGMEDGAGKTALAMALFGRAGAAMIPMLNQGAQGLRDMMKEADELGAVFDQKTAKAAEDFNDNLKRLSIINSAFSRQLMVELVPSLKILSQSLLDLAKDQEAVKRNVQVFLGVINHLAFEVSSVIVFFQRFGAEVMALMEVFKATNWADMKARWAEFSAEGAKTREEFDKLRTSFQDFREQANMIAQAGETAGNGLKKVAAPILGEGAKVAQEFDKMLEAVRKQATATTADAAALGLAAGARERLRVVMQAENFAREKNIKLTDAQRMAMTKAADEAQAAAMKMQGAQITQDMLTPAEKYRQEMANLKQLLDANAISQETFNRKVLELKFPGVSQFLRDASDANKRLDQLATGGLNSFADNMTDAAMKTKSLSDAFRDMTNSMLRDATRLALKGLMGGVIGSLGSALGFAPRIGNNATGTDNWRGGLTWVGERGKELVNLPRGSQVVPNHEVKKMAGSGGFTFAPVVNMPGAASKDVDRCMEGLRALASDLKRTKSGMASAAHASRNGVGLSTV